MPNATQCLLSRTSRIASCLAFACLCFFVLATEVAGQSPTTRQAIPPADKLAKSRELLREIYGAEVDAATTTEAKLALAAKLLKLEADTRNDSDAWTLLQVARQLATSGGDPSSIQRACAALGARYEVDPFTLETESLLATPDEGDNAAKVKIAQRLSQLADVGLARDDFAFVRRLVEAANRQATAARNLALARETFDRLDQLDALAPAFEEAKAARETLKTDGKNPAANLKQGKFLCFVLGNFERGLPLLALSEDSTLATLAKRETAMPTAANELAGLGDAWWELAASLDKLAATKSKTHAADLYRRALPSLTGLTQARAETRIREMGISLTVARAPMEPRPEPVPSRNLGNTPPVKFPFDAKAAREAQESWASDLGFKSYQVQSKTGFQLVVVPPGTLLMGTPPTEAERVNNEGPQNQVRISKPLLVGIHEITQRQFEMIMSFNPSYYRLRPEVRNLDVRQFPVESVTWWDACEFCNRLSRAEHLSEYYRLSDVKKDGKSFGGAKVEIVGGSGYRLPTEAEFEHFTRAGTTTPFSFGSVHDGTQGNVLGTKPYGTTKPGPALNRTTTVGSYQPNPFGIFDVDGNVSEWCWDYYDPMYFFRLKRSVARVDPLGPETGTQRCSRSNAFAYEPKHGRSGRRHGDKPDFRSGWVGFRVVRNPE